MHTPTQLIYLDTNSPLICATRIVDAGQDNVGHYLILDKTAAHVRGGGQLGDRGRIGTATLLDVRRANDEVRHYVEGVSPVVGANVAVEVDPEFRRLSSRWHTAGHLLAAALEHEIPGFAASAAQQWPTDAWVTGLWAVPIAEDLTERLQRFIDDARAADLPVVVKLGDVRTVQIQGHRPVPCGGTHVASIGAIGPLHVEDVRIKKGVLKARYTCDDEKKDIDFFIGLPSC
jgi:alanyl-tRNA synthetase